MAALAGEIALEVDRAASAHQGISVHEQQRHQDAKLDCRMHRRADSQGIGKSNGIFLCPPGRTRALKGIAGGALAWPGARWSAATPPPDLKTA